MTYSSGAKRLIWRFARPVYRRLQKAAPQEFSIGIAIGDSPWSVRLPKSIANPVLTPDDVTDVPATLVADPFMCQRDGRWYLFFEVVNHLTRRGEIGVPSAPTRRRGSTSASSSRSLTTCRTRTYSSGRVLTT